MSRRNSPAEKRRRREERASRRYRRAAATTGAQYIDALIACVQLRGWGELTERKYSEGLDPQATWQRWHNRVIHRLTEMG